MKKQKGSTIFQEILSMERFQGQLLGGLAGLLLLAPMFAPVHAQPPGGIIKYGFETLYETALVADINPGPADAVNLLFGIAPRNHYALGFAGAHYFQVDDGQVVFKQLLTLHRPTHLEAS